MNNNRIPTISESSESKNNLKDIDISQNENLKRAVTLVDETGNDSLKKLSQNKDISRVATIIVNSTIEDISIFDNSLYISDNEQLKLKIKKEDWYNRVKFF